MDLAELMQEKEAQHLANSKVPPQGINLAFPHLFLPLSVSIFVLFFLLFWLPLLSWTILLGLSKAYSG